MSKIYLSGAITSDIYHSKKFLAAEVLLGCQGYEVVNPLKLLHDNDKTWSSYMKEDIQAMMSCDCIYMIKGWERSKGARIEFNLALELGIEVVFEK